MSLTNAIAQQSAGMGDLSLSRDMRNMERDIKLRDRQYELQKMANENKAAMASQLVGSTLGLAKGAYGAYQDHEHEKSVNDAVGLRKMFQSGDFSKIQNPYSDEGVRETRRQQAIQQAGDRQYYDSIRKNYGDGVLEDVYFRQRLPQAGSVSEALQRQGLLSADSQPRTWMDDFADLAANLPTFG